MCATASSWHDVVVSEAADREAEELPTAAYRGERQRGHAERWLGILAVQPAGHASHTSSPVRRDPPRLLVYHVGTAALLGVDETLLAQQRESMLDGAVADLVSLHQRPL